MKFMVKYDTIFILESVEGKQSMSILFLSAVDIPDYRMQYNKNEFFDEVYQLLENKDDNPFSMRVYRHRLVGSLQYSSEYLLVCRKMIP